MSKIVENYLLQEVIGQGQYGKTTKITDNIYFLLIIAYLIIF